MSDIKKVLPKSHKLNKVNTHTVIFAGIMFTLFILLCQHANVQTEILQNLPIHWLDGKIIHSKPQPHGGARSQSIT